MRDRNNQLSRRRRAFSGMPVDVVARGLQPTDLSLARVRGLSYGQPQLDEIRRVVRVDPALTVATLRHAYKTQRDGTKDYTNIDQVVTRLGTLAMEEVLSQVGRSVSLDRTSPGSSRISAHCSRVAVLSVEVARMVEVIDTAPVYLTSLLHDVGKLLAIQAGEIDYESVPARYDHPDLLNIHERRTLGYDHAKLGWHALSVWGVPEPIPTVVAWHHQGSRAYSVGGDIAQLVAIVRTADMLDRMLGRVDELDELDMWRLERNLACRRLLLGPEMFRREWARLQKARNDAVPADPSAVLLAGLG